MDGDRRGSRPRDDILLCLYLGNRFETANKADHVSYEDLAKEAKTTKQNVMKLAKGRTVGAAVLFALAASLYGGSMDAMIAASRWWWENLDQETLDSFLRRARVIADNNPLTGERPKGPPKADAPAQREPPEAETPVPGSVIRESRRPPAA